MSKDATNTAKPEGGAKPEELQPDPVLEHPDDPAAVEPASAAAPAADVSAEEPERRKPELIKDEGRDEITRRYRAKRKAEREADGDAPPPLIANSDPEPAPVVAAADSNAPGRDEPTPAAVADPAAAGGASAPVATKVDDVETIIVDGQAKQMTRAELRAFAQERLLAPKGPDLAEVKSLLEEVKSLRAGTPAPAVADEVDPAVAERAAAQSERTKKRVEKIQIGDPEEGAQAFDEFRAEIRDEVLAEAKQAANVTADEIDRRVDQRLAQKQAKIEADEAVEKFKDKFPELVGNKLLTTATMTAVTEEFVTDLRSVGVPDAEISALQADPLKLAAKQRELRQAGHKVRAFGTVLEKAGERMVTEFKLRPPVEAAVPDPKTPGSGVVPSLVNPPRAAVVDPKAQARIEQKRANPQQPRAAGVRGEIAPKPKRLTGQEQVAKMRADRGYRAF